MRSNANGRYAHYPSEVILDAEKVKSTVYCCWLVPGRASGPKMFAPKPLISVGNWLTQVYVENDRLKRPLRVCARVAVPLAEVCILPRVLFSFIMPYRGGPVGRRH